MKTKLLWLAPLVLAAFVLPYQPLTVFEGPSMILPALQSSVGGGQLSSLKNATAWLNTQPLTPEALRGKVVLVNFWTYTCINWHRQLPYVRAWADKYKDQGLVVIGVHSPEFEFERNVDSVRRSIGELDVRFPVAVDSGHAIWNAFSNRYWPALYFIDATGRLRHTQFGEGDYEQSENFIRKLLAEAGAAKAGGDFVTVNAGGSQAAPDWTNLKSPETYLGYERGEGFASEGQSLNASVVYALPPQLRLNNWALAGNWTVRAQFASLNTASGRIAYRFHARDLHIVMGPARSKPVRFRVLIDGKPPGLSHGTDIDAGGNGTLTDQRLYQLIRQPLPIADRTFEIEFLDPGAEAFAFTFG